MASTASPQHEWLQRLVGEWTFKSEIRMAPDEAPETSTGTETVRSLGGLWVVAEGEMEMPGVGTGSNVMTLGYNPDTNRFVGTWVGSMMTNLWIYDGELDEAQTKLSLQSEGPAMDDSGGSGIYRDVIEMLGENERTLRSFSRQPDGSWLEFVTTTYQRKG